MKPFVLALKIYLLTNLLLCAIIALSATRFSAMPEFLELSMSFSFPALILVWITLSLIKELALSVYNAWLAFILAISVIAIIPIMIIGKDGFWDPGINFFLIVEASAFGGVLLQSISLHRFFKS